MRRVFNFRRSEIFDITKMTESIFSLEYYKCLTFFLDCTDKILKNVARVIKIMYE